jgi:hypothetical protein
MIRGMQRKHDGSPRRLFWDSRTVVFDNSVVDVDEMAIFTFWSLLLRCLGLDAWRSGASRRAQLQ